MLATGTVRCWGRTRAGNSATDGGQLQHSVAVTGITMPPRSPPRPAHL
ncbi:MAG: hypothetical protein IPH38_20750 [Candidatus Microthrix sp.]|nr:hypothetical protein [Candidatus Microthrix sp.]